MCGRYVLVQKIELIERRFNVTLPCHFDWSPSYNISPGRYAPVITQEHPHELQFFRFGMRPHWSKKDMFLINARSEGDRNKENDPEYAGSKDIITKPAFRKPIRSQRCLVVADAFIEGTTKEGLERAHVVYLQNKVRPFAFAGIYDVWENVETGEMLRSFSILTTVANDLMQKIPHQRTPVILHPGQEKKWLNSTLSLRDVTKMLKPFPSELMNAYPIGNKIKDPVAEGKDLLVATGPELQNELSVKKSQKIELTGMGTRKHFNEQNWDQKRWET